MSNVCPGANGFSLLIAPKGIEILLANCLPLVGFYF